MAQLAKKTILIGGGTGFIGSALAKALKMEGYNIQIVSRMPGENHISWSDLNRDGLPSSILAVINTAGQNVFDFKRRWTPGFKQNVYASRVNTTKFLAHAIDKADEKDKPEVFINMSGVAYYKPDDHAEYTEDSPGGDYDFLSDLVTNWEAATELESSPNVRIVKARTGVVLSRAGGVVSNMYWPFWFGVGGPIASGKQYFPWIHLHDLIGFMIYAIRNPKVNGIYNMVAPQTITNAQFASALASAMWRPALFPMPAFVLNWLFSEERAKIMIEGQKVIPKRTLESGYKYFYPDIESACTEVAKMIYADEAH